MFFIKNFRFVFITISLSIFLVSCSVSKNYNPDKKYPKEILQQDYSLLRNILEKKHPSLYWYTSKDSMNFYFDHGYESIPDSMTALQFGWKVLAPLINKIHCGHTSFSMGKAWGKYIKNKTIPSFPLYMRIWSDTMVVIANLNQKDSLIKRGTIITSINGVRSKELITQMSSYLAEDGYAGNVNYARLSLSFPYFHRNIYGLYKTYSVQYIDSAGIERKTIIPLYKPDIDSSKKTKPVIRPEQKKHIHKERLQNIRQLKFDSAYNLAVMKINSFSKGHEANFFRRSFKKIRKRKTDNLVIDIRNNGGGEINNFVSLTKYIRNTPFKVADTATAIARSFWPYSRNIKSDFFDRLGMFFLTKKEDDNLYHFRFWENHSFKPKHKNHFNGNVFVLTNGLTFSASSLFCNAVKGQENVKLVGEETGGGWYGNSGIIIPDIILPNTKLRVRLPMFRLVQYQHVAIKGTGVIPDIIVNPTIDATIKNIDLKMKVVKEIIRKKG